MKTRRDPDLLIKAFLEDGVNELPDRSYDAVRAATEQTRQWVVIGPWREQQMTRFAMLGVAAAVIVLAAVVGLRFLPGDSGVEVGGQPTDSATDSRLPTPAPTQPSTPSPTSSPTPTATALTTPWIDPDLGPLDAGTQVAHPFAPENYIYFEFTVPSNSWEGVDWRSEDGGLSGVAWAGDSGGVAVGFLRVDTLNQEPCNWSGTEDDVAVGPSVDDLVTALTRTKEGIDGANNRYKVSEPVDVSLGGYSGKQVVVTMPAIVDQCDEGYLIWNAEGFDPDAMGPDNRWTLSILDVEGERLVVLVSDFEDSDPERVRELQSIVDSIVIGEEGTG